MTLRHVGNVTNKPLEYVRQREITVIVEIDVNYTLGICQNKNTTKWEEQQVDRNKYM